MALKLAMINADIIFQDPLLSFNIYIFIPSKLKLYLFQDPLPGLETESGAF